MTERVRWYNRLAAWLWSPLGEWWLDLCCPVWEEEVEAEMEAEYEAQRSRQPRPVRGLNDSLPF